MSTAIRLLGICGSLRAKSYNRYALNAASELMPEGMTMEMASIGDIPLFNQDLCDQGMPPAVSTLRAQIARADGIYFATPEYNYSVTGVLKNAIDWASRPPEQPFQNKPVAMVSATVGLKGGVSGQYDLRKILAQLGVHLLVRPEVFIGNEASKFDASGKLTDEAARKFLGDQMLAFRDWILRVRKLG
ncbi:MAG: NAD(P)H-dependent oxidoreductase [Betaproteobacteria bacterium]|nr:NAD(P)H-dependent oxidoreductase [Betaproteobacteria bacterium]